MVIKDGDVQTASGSDTFLLIKTGVLSRRVILLKRFFLSEIILKDILKCMEEHIYHPIADTIVKTSWNWRHWEHEEMHGEASMLQAQRD